jgi:hypothetical protein
MAAGRAATSSRLAVSLSNRDRSLKMLTGLVNFG